VWDYLLKSQFVKLVPTVYSSQKFGKVLKTNMEAEVDLYELKEQFQNLADNSPDIIIRFDKNHRHLFVNKAVKTQLGIDTAVFTNKTHRETGIFQEEIIVFWENAINQVFESSSPCTLEFEFNTVFFEWRLFPEMDQQGRVQTVLSIARNITDAKMDQKIIHDSEERLNMALQATSLGLWDWNLLSNEVFFSPIYYEMLGYEFGDFPSELESWYKLLHDDDMVSANKVIENSLRDHSLGNYGRKVYYNQ
jgi:PAS domain S-box-containing protein